MAMCRAGAKKPAAVRQRGAVSDAAPKIRRLLYFAGPAPPAVMCARRAQSGCHDAVASDEWYFASLPRIADALTLSLPGRGLETGL